MEVILQPLPQKNIVLLGWSSDSNQLLFFCSFTLTEISSHNTGNCYLKHGVIFGDALKPSLKELIMDNNNGYYVIMNGKIVKASFLQWQDSKGSGFNSHPGHVLRFWLRRFTMIIFIGGLNKLQIYIGRSQNVNRKAWKKGQFLSGRC